MATDGYTTKDVAEILGVTQRTVQLWSQSGKIEFRKTSGGHRRFSQEAINKLLASQKALEAEQNQAEGSGKCKVLVIEDDSMLLNLYNINITSWGLPIELELSQDGYDGLVKIGAFKPDVLILDLTLPSVDGFQIIATLLKNKLLSKMKLIVVTGLSETEITENIHHISHIRVLKKPIDFKVIRAEIEAQFESLNIQTSAYNSA